MENFEKTLSYLRDKTNNFKVDIVIVLGSGLGVFCDDMEGIRIKYSDIPSFPKSSVQGHKGELLFSNISGKNCAIMQGRFHYYEGHSLHDTTYPIKILKKMGAHTIFITNASGALSKKFNVGDIMLINDHINFMGDNPLRGKNDDTLGERFPDMSEVYCPELKKIAKNCAQELNIDLKEGVYLATMGPSYETKAEVKMFSILGADVVGMSSVPEAIVANYLKMRTIGFSMITNHATGVSDNKLTHKEVLEIGKVSGVKLSQLIKKIIEKL